jgi:hypothetical protein
MFYHKFMKVFLWILQSLVALWNIIGGAYLVSNYKNVVLPNVLTAFPASFWMLLGVIQVLCALALVYPAIAKAPTRVIAVSAAVLSVNSLLGMFLYAPYSGFPGLLWALIPAIPPAYIAYKKW